MDLEQHLTHLESHRDWQGLVEALEQAITTEADATVKAACFLRLGRTLHLQFLQGVKALKHFQDAFKLDPSLLEALEDARAIYWELGKLNMVVKLIELELKNVADVEFAASLQVELGDALADGANYERAAEAYASAVQNGHPYASVFLEDVQTGEDQWQERVGFLLRSAHEADDPELKCQTFLRAARLARRYAPEDFEGIVAQAYRAQPRSVFAAALWESLLIEQERTDEILKAQRDLIDGAADAAEASELTFVFGARWALRHQNAELGAQLLEEAFRKDPERFNAYAYIREMVGARGGDWDSVIALASEVAENAEPGPALALFADVGRIVWRDQSNLLKARTYFERVAALDPGHPQLAAFELQIGEKLGGTAAEEAGGAPPVAAEEAGAHAEGAEDAGADADGTGESVAEDAPPAEEADADATGAEEASAEDARAAESGAEDAPLAETETGAGEAGAEEAGTDEAEASEAAAAEAPEPEAPAVDEAKVAELREKLEGIDQEKRVNEYVKTLVALADELQDPPEQAELYAQAGDIYANRLGNAAEAVRTYEKLIDLDATNIIANDFLRATYEKRRDWEKLIHLNQAEANLLEGDDRLNKLREIAQLATEKVKKPDICIGLWAEVLAADENDVDALSALQQLYERARDYEKLADVLEKLVDFTADEKEQLQLLTKLGQVTGDRLKDDARAVEAYRKLLVLSPDDRRAQEQLKKRYVALGRWDDLEVFYSETGKWDEFIRVLESNESKTKDMDQRIGMLMKVAELWMTQKGKPDRASRAYEKILNLDESNLAAAERLIPIYTEANNPKGLSGAIEVKLGHVEDPDEKLALLREVAGLYEGRLRDNDKAFERYLAAFSLAATDEQSQTDVERSAQGTGRWDDLITAYRAAIDAAAENGDAFGANQLRLRLGRVFVEEVERVEDALAEYRVVYDSEPDNETALTALEQLYSQTEKWRELLEVYGRKRELAADPDDRKGILYETAKVHEEKLEEPAAAIETYQLVLEDDPTDDPALAALDRLYLQTQQWEPYADVLRRRVVLDVPEETLVDLKFRLAQTQAQHLDDAPGALENYREILFLNQEHEGARLALEALLEDEALKGEAAAILESIYEVRGDWEKLIGALEILAESDPGRRVELLRKIASTAALQLNALDRALDAQARALKDDPSIPDTRTELEGYAEQANAWEQLIGIYTAIADTLEDLSLARDFFMRIATIEERLEHVEQAAAAYDKVLLFDGGDMEALSALDALYRNNERWEALVGVYRRRIELVEDPTEREALYDEMAKVYEERLERPEEAIKAYQEVLSLEPASQVALAALDGLFSRQNLWSELAENLETQLGLADDEDQQLALMLRLAALREQQMNQVEDAIEGYRQVLDREPTNEQALSALERLGAIDQHALSIAEILEPLYRTQGDFQKLIGVHEVQVAKADDHARQVELLHQIAELYEDAAGDINKAFDTYARALAYDPGHEATQEGLDRLARATGRFQDLAKVFEELGAQQEDPELGSQLYTFAARVFENDVMDTARAIALYQQVLTIDPMNLPAAESLERLFQATEQYGEMSITLQKKARILEDIDDQKAALYQAATLEEEVLERKENAIGVYLKVLEVDPEDLRSIDSLINLYLGLARWEELLGVYNKKADLVLDTQEKKLIFYQVGAVYERELQNVANAIDTYQKVLELDPDDLEALNRLDVLYQSAENWQELLSVLTHESELTADPIEAVSFQYRIAELYEKRLDDVERSVELYREILNIQPDHTATLEALEGIKAGAAAPLAAAGVLEPVYDAMGEYQKLISVLEVQVRFAEDPFSKVDLLHRIARLFEESLADPQSAFDTYARAVVEDSQNEESLGAIERLAMMIERWPQVAQLYDAELAKLTEEPERVVELGLRVAQVYEVQLENVDQAVERYRTVVEADPENHSAVRALDRLFSQSERWAELAEVLKKEAEIGETPDEILELKFRLGQVYQSQLGNVDQAIEAYREVITSAPEHVPALEALEGLFEAGVKQLEVGDILEPLYQNTAEWEKLLRVREAQLTHTQEPEDRMAMYHRMAEDAEERLLDPGLAFGIFVRALKENPLDERSGDELERLAGAIDEGWEGLANAYADVLGIEGLAAETQAVIGKRLARVFEEELADAARAEETYRYVLSVVPQEPESLENLDRIYSSLEQYAELAGILEQRAVAAEDEHDKVEFYTRLGRVYEEQLEQPENAIRAYRAIFDGLEPANEDAVQALGRIYAAQENWTDLNVVFHRELENAAGDMDEADIRAKIAHLAANQLGKVDDAIDGWKRVLELRGEDPESLHALANLYEQQQQWAELTDVLERHFDIAESDEDRVAVLSRRAKLFIEQLGRDDEALETWHRVLDIDYANIDALRAVAQIWRTREDAEELVQALHNIVDRAAAMVEPTELVETFRELGRTYGTKLERSFDAADAWRNLLEVDPADREALDELEKIYRADEQFADVVAVKVQRSDALEEPAEKVRELLEVTEIWKAQEDYDQATPAFEKILTIDPTHELAFGELEKLHKAAERWEPMVEMYLNRLEHTEPVKERSDLLRRIAGVFEEKLDDKNQAFDALVSAFADDYGDDETVDYLGKMAQATNRWGELINTANAWLQEQTETKPKIQLCLRLGKWYGENLDHPEYAQPYYGQVMQLDPNNVEVRRRMAAIHRMSGDWQKMGVVLTQALEVAVANDDRKAILHDLGELLERHMGDQHNGITHYKRVLEIDPHYRPTLENLERIYGEQQNNQELVAVLKAKVAGMSKPEEIASNKLRMGGLYETALGNLDAAGQTYREVIELEPSNILGLRGLERVYGALQNWNELVTVLEQQLDVVETERERVEVLLKLAAIQEEHFLKADVAAQRLEQALEIDVTEGRAYRALARCYRRLKQWLDLINTYERHIAEAGDSAIKVELYGEIAQVYADEVGDVDRAIDAYQNITDIDDTNIPALEALSKLFEKQGDASQAIEAMTRVADLTTDGNQRVEMYFRIGTSLEKELGDRYQARERFEMALDLDPSHLPTLAALRTIALDEADWDAAARYLEQESTNTESPRMRAKLLVELGKLRQEQLDEPELAVQAYENAVELDDDSEEAALPLVEEYIRTEQWQKAEPLAELLVRKSKNRERHEQHLFFKMQGQVLAALGQHDKALKAYTQAHQLDLTDQESIKGIADVAFEVSDWPTSLTNYQKVLTSLGEEDIEERTYVYYRLGCIKREQAQSKQAINNFEKALGLNPDHRPTLDALVDVYEKGSDWKQVAAYKRQILDSVMEEDERYDLLSEIGDIWAEKEKEPVKAIEALEEARYIRPIDHVLLHKLLGLYQSAAQWEQMVDTLQSIAELEERPDRKAKYFFTMAQLYRDKVDDKDRAVELFNEALDLNPDFLEAFERINRVLTEERNWKQLERSYRKMIHRVAGRGKRDLEHTLWHQLGIVYRDRMEKVDEAIEAFKMATTAKPDVVEFKILGELYESQERWDEAIKAQRDVLRNDPLRIEPYRDLYRLFLHKQSYDEAWLLAAAMAFLRKADPETQEFYDNYKPQGMLQPKGRLTEELWKRYLLHENLDEKLSGIYQVIAGPALGAKVDGLRSAGQLPVLDPRTKQDPATSTVTFAKTFGWAAQVLNVASPELYVRSDQPIQVMSVEALPPASVAGQGVLSGFSPQELAYVCGRHLASYRPEFFIKNIFKTQGELTMMLFAGVVIGNPSQPLPQDMQQSIQQTAKSLVPYLQRDPRLSEGVRYAVKAFVEGGAKSNIKRWSQSADMTGIRAGLLLCGDVSIAAKIMASEQAIPGDMSQEDKVKDLLQFSVSDEYAQLRKALGVTIEVG